MCECKALARPDVVSYPFRVRKAHLRSKWIAEHEAVINFETSNIHLRQSNNNNYDNENSDYEWVDAAHEDLKHEQHSAQHTEYDYWINRINIPIITLDGNSRTVWQTVKNQYFNKH